MSDPYPLADEAYQREWLGVEAEQRSRLLADSLPRFQRQLDSIVDGWTRRWADEGADQPSEAARQSIIDANQSRVSEDYRRFEESRLGFGSYGQELLGQARAEVPPDPAGGHRPIWLGGAEGMDLPRVARGVPSTWSALVCLDCDLTWVLAAGNPTDAALRHRAVHLDPPAWALCELDPMPDWFLAWAPGMPRRRYVPSGRERRESWPAPAIGRGCFWHGRSGPYLYQLCTACLDRLRSDYDPSASDGWDGRFVPADELGPANAVQLAPWSDQGYGARLPGLEGSV